MNHHGTIKKYTAALLNLFNDLEVQYTDSLNNIRTKNVPIVYSSREKARVIEGKTAEQLSTGNYNVLPRASLSISTMLKSEYRTKNKNMKINTVAKTDSFEFMYNSVPYEFTYELTVLCRGMNEATMIIEQIAPKFNPTTNIDIWEANNLHEPTRIPVKLLDIGISSEEYEELSSNLVTVSVGLSLQGNLYPPINSIQRIKDLKIYVNQQEDNYFTRKTVLGWDINESGTAINPSITSVNDVIQYPPVIVDVVPIGNVAVGSNILNVIFSDADNKVQELTFDWVIISGPATITTGADQVTLTVTAVGSIEIQITITDVHGNFASLNKIFTV